MLSHRIQYRKEILLYCSFWSADLVVLFIVLYSHIHSTLIYWALTNYRCINKKNLLSHSRSFDVTENGTVR